VLDPDLIQNRYSFLCCVLELNPGPTMLRLGVEPNPLHKTKLRSLGVEPRPANTKTCWMLTKSEPPSKSKKEVGTCSHYRSMWIVRPTIVGCVSQRIVMIGLVIYSNQRYGRLCCDRKQSDLYRTHWVRSISFHSIDTGCIGSNVIDIVFRI
jgi:hypothetical protein